MWRSYDQTGIPHGRHRDRLGPGGKDCGIFAVIVNRYQVFVPEGEDNQTIQESARISQRDCRHAGGFMDWRAEAVGSASRCVSPTRTENPYRRSLACRLEWQAAEDGDDSFQEHEQD